MSHSAPNHNNNLCHADEGSISQVTQSEDIIFRIFKLRTNYVRTMYEKKGYTQNVTQNLTKIYYFITFTLKFRHIIQSILVKI